MRSPAKIKVRVQGHIDPDLEQIMRQRCHEARRPMSREVEYFVTLGMIEEGLLSKEYLKDLGE